MTAIEAAAREIEATLSRRDYSRLRELLTDDFVDHGAPPGSPTGADAYVDTMKWVTETLGIHFEMQESVSDGDQVALRILARGIYDAPQFGLPATGRPYAMQTMHFYKGRNGKLAEHWGLSDQLGMLLQVGAFPVASPNAATHSPTR